MLWNKSWKKQVLLWIFLQHLQPFWLSCRPPRFLEVVERLRPRRCYTGSSGFAESCQHVCGQRIFRTRSQWRHSSRHGRFVIKVAFLIRGLFICKFAVSKRIPILIFKNNSSISCGFFSEITVLGLNICLNDHF